MTAGLASSKGGAVVQQDAGGQHDGPPAPDAGQPPDVPPAAEVRPPARERPAARERPGAGDRAQVAPGRAGTSPPRSRSVLARRDCAADAVHGQGHVPALCRDHHRLGLWELNHALSTRDIHLPLIPIAAGGIAMVTLAYWTPTRWTCRALALAAIAVFAWRLPGGAYGYVPDVSASLFTLVYLFVLAVFVRADAGPADGAPRACAFIVYRLQRYRRLRRRDPARQAPDGARSARRRPGRASPARVLCLVAGAIGADAHCHGQVWQGLLLGLGSRRCRDARRPGRVHDQARPGDQGHGPPAARATAASWTGSTRCSSWPRSSGCCSHYSSRMATPPKTPILTGTRSSPSRQPARCPAAGPGRLGARDLLAVDPADRAARPAE